MNTYSRFSNMLLWEEGRDMGRMGRKKGQKDDKLIEDMESGLERRDRKR